MRTLQWKETRQSWLHSEIYIQSAPNSSNETYTFMCLDRAGRAKTALKFKYANTYTIQSMGQGISLKSERNKP